MTSPMLPLPNRPLSFKGDVFSLPRGHYFSILILLVVAGFFLYWQGPNLLRDVVISQHPLALPDASIQNAKCKTHRAIFTDCEAHLAYSHNGRNYESDTEMFFVDLHVGDYQTGVVISAEKPELATLSIGLDKLWDRIMSLVVLVLLLVGGAIAIGIVAIRIRRAREQLSYPARLFPVPVQITAFTKNRQGLFITYAEKISSQKTGRSAFTQLDAGQEPLIIGSAKGKAVALAVRHGDTALPVLLDSRLDRVDLTQEEREIALAPLAAAVASVPGLDTFTPKKKSSALRGVITFFAVILLAVVAAFGYWLWYVTSAPSPFTSPGMDINNMMPAPLNKWGCDQLKKRFGNGAAPYGCIARDFVNWK